MSRTILLQRTNIATTVSRHGRRSSVSHTMEWNERVVPPLLALRLPRFVQLAKDCCPLLAMQCRCAVSCFHLHHCCLCVRARVYGPWRGSRRDAGVVSNPGGGRLGGVVGLVHHALDRTTWADLDPRRSMGLDWCGRLLSKLLPLRAQLHAGVDAVLFAVGVLPVCLHDLPLLLLRVLHALPQYWGKRTTYLA